MPGQIKEGGGLGSARRSCVCHLWSRRYHMISQPRKHSQSLKASVSSPEPIFICWKLISSCFKYDEVRDTLHPQITAPWHTEEYKLKECEQMAEAERLL